MQVAAKTREPAQINAVALKAYARIVDAWALNLRDAAGLADMSESTWKRAKKPDFAGELTKDQLLRSPTLSRKAGSRGRTPAPCSAATVPSRRRSRVVCPKFSPFGPILTPCVVVHEANRDFRSRAHSPLARNLSQATRPPGSRRYRG
jgi:hypothetical protein